MTALSAEATVGKRRAAAFIFSGGNNFTARYNYFFVITTTLKLFLYPWRLQEENHGNN
jgi:hypothetical protein